MRELIVTYLKKAGVSAAIHRQLWKGHSWQSRGAVAPPTPPAPPPPPGGPSPPPPSLPPSPWDLHPQLLHHFLLHSYNLHHHCHLLPSHPLPPSPISSSALSIHSISSTILLTRVASDSLGETNSGVTVRDQHLVHVRKNRCRTSRWSLSPGAMYPVPCS